MSETKRQAQEFFDKLNAEQRAVSIPYYLHEGEMFRLERLNKRWFIAFLIVLVMLFVTNGAWIAYEMSMETYEYTQEAQYDTSVTTSVLNNGTGRIVYNGNESETNGENPQEEIQQQSGN